MKANIHTKSFLKRIYKNYNMNIQQENVHMVWIGDNLSLLEQLTIKLYQQKGVIPNLWTYNEIKNVPEGTILRDASEILSKDSLFSFQGCKPSDIGFYGSYSHWSDRFALAVLQKYGGWYSQLDVACLKLPTCEYYLSTGQSPGTAIDVSIMKLPKNAPFLKACIEELTQKINKETCTTINWADSFNIMSNHINHNNLSQYYTHNVEGWSPYLRYMIGNSMPPENTEFIHWWNVALKDQKHYPKPGTFYYKLLKNVELI